jgi:DnaJ-class molecular chaperone
MGKDLHIYIKLRLFQSLYGFTKMITHLDGRHILLKYDKMLTQMNTTMKVKNEGLGGHLYIHITSSMPKLDRLDEQENMILKKLLIKAHLSEFQKEQNISKNSDKLTKVDLEEIDIMPEEQNQEHEESGPAMGCTQQ